MGVSSDTHASSTSATNTPEAISQTKNREHVKYLNKRMEWWKHGNLEELISECEAIQERLKRSVKTKTQSHQKAFCRLLL